MSDKTKKISLEKAMTWNGVNYAPGINTMPEDAAKYAVKRKFGRSSDQAAAAEFEDEAFTPLSVEETMERFSSGDSSDEVFKSLKFHQQAIVKSRGPLPEDGEPTGQQNSGKSDEDLKSEADAKAKVESDAKAKADADAAAESEKGSSGGNASKGLPDNFPMKHVFEKNGFQTVESVQALSRDELIKLDGIAEASADKALAYGK